MTDTPFHLNGRRILVTGSSSGLGRAIAEAAARMGAVLILSGRNRERLQETLQLLPGEGHTAVEGDLRDDAFLDGLAANIEGRLDGVVLNAGIMKLLPLPLLTDEWVKEITLVNYLSPVKLTRNLIRQKKINKGASIVFITSINGGVIGTKAQSMYASTKAGITGFARSLAVDLGARKIRLNCIAPGMILTSGSQPVFEGLTPEGIEEELKKYPLGTFGQPIDVANAAVYLLSDASQWVTGTTLVVDGGFTAQ